MGHDIHFLERLERYSPSHTELAMSLYRDPELIKAVLNDRRVPDGAERVAIAITNEPSGPHIVVQRNGRFVTALGEGMTTGELPIISRAALDSAGARMQRLRSLIDEARSVAGPTGVSSSVLRRLLTAGPWLSREEAASASVWVRLGGDFPSMVRHLAKACDDVRLAMVASKKSRQARRRIPEIYRPYWELTWAYAHLLGIVMDGCRSFFVDNQKTATIEYLDLIHIDRFVGSGLRAAWISARFGKLLLGGIKERWSLNHHATDDVRVNADALAIIAMKHGKLRAEAEKILRRPPGHWRNLDARELQIWNAEAAGILSYSREAVDNPKAAHQKYEILARQHVIELTRHLPVGAAEKFENEETIPQSIALAAPLVLGSEPGALTPRGRTLMSTALPWLSRVSLEDTYLPGEYLRAWETPFQPEWIEKLSERLYEDMKAETVVRDSPRIGRNDPCTCGSEKKFKKCCGA